MTKIIQNWIPLFLLLVGLTLVTLTVLAKEDHLEARRLLETDSILPLESVLENVPTHYRGRVLEVELEQESDQYIYEIEILNSTGQVHELEFDALTGELLDAEMED